ncbi:hypothetical protein HZ326_11492 [Fusarium oxysporum f. sp. albedinis]|nr:hypothetical protein HZ326_11492 [Fusarium oxysporum f. sp. albedinis]
MDSRLVFISYVLLRSWFFDSTREKGTRDILFWKNEELVDFSIELLTWGLETPGCVIQDAELARVCR